MKQYIKPLYQYINEEHIFHEADFDIYKNPESIKRMSPWKRAISDKYGNLFVMDDRFFWYTHLDMMKLLDNTGDFNKINYKYFLNVYVLWMQAGNSNKFYLSESYNTNESYNDMEDHKSHINKLTKLVKKKNSNFKFLTEGNIWDNIIEPIDPKDLKTGRFKKYENPDIPAYKDFLNENYNIKTQFAKN
jgi:hypothetical protein